jgi:hypothetical protein
MKAMMLITGGGPMVVLSSHRTPDDDVFVGKLKAKGIDRFMAYELSLDDVQTRYGGHFHSVVNDLHETDDLRVLDVNGRRVFRLFGLKGLGDPFVYEPDGLATKVYMD